MKCPVCAAEIAGDARICPACGADVTAATPPGDGLAGLLESAKGLGREAMATDIAKDAQKLVEQGVEKGTKLGREALDTDTGREIARLAAEAKRTSQSALGTRMGKEMAVGAAIGAVIAVPLPFVGPLLGAVAGAGIAWYRAKGRIA